MHTTAELVHKTVVVWLRWWRIAERFLRLILHRRLWGLTGTHLRTIVGRGDTRAIQLRRSWADLGRELKAIKARGRAETSIHTDDRSEPGPPYSREEEETQESSYDTFYA